MDARREYDPTVILLGLILTILIYPIAVILLWALLLALMDLTFGINEDNVETYHKYAVIAAITIVTVISLIIWVPILHNFLSAEHYRWRER